MTETVAVIFIGAIDIAVLGALVFIVVAFFAMPQIRRAQ